MLRTRVLTALVLLGGLLLALFLLPDAGWLLFVALVCAGAAWEWGGLASFRTGPRASFAAVAAIACFLLGWISGLAGTVDGAPEVLVVLYVASALFWLLAVPFWLANKWRISGVGSALAVGSVVLLPPALALAHLRQLGVWWLLAAMAMVWVADIAAYFAGRRFGRHKLAPGISPGKTWEGAAGAALGVVVFGLLVVWQWGPSLPTAAAGGGLVVALIGITAVSIVGDLFESLLKRQAGVKDSGSILPGHGGILDRIDSLTSTLPLAGLAALWFAR